MSNMKKIVISLSFVIMYITHFIGVSVAEKTLDNDAVISIAQKYIMEKYDVTAEVFAQYQLAECSYITRDEGEWLVIFAGDCADSKFDTNTYSVYLTPQGVVKTSSEPLLANDLNEAFQQLIRERGMFVTWSLQQKYEFSQEWKQKIETAEQQRPYNEAKDSGYMQYLSQKEYLLPNASDISQVLATSIATSEIVRQLGELEHVTANYSIYYSFLGMDELRIWRVFYVPINRTDTDCGYRFDIDAQSGDVVEVLHQISYEADWATYYE